MTVPMVSNGRRTKPRGLDECHAADFIIMMLVFVVFSTSNEV